MVDKLKKLGTIVTTITSILSLLATIVYLTWFQASLDKRTSLLEQEQIEINRRLSDLKSDENQNHERIEIEIDGLYTLLIKGN